MDKIIDGIDVSECKYLHKSDKNYCYMSQYSDYCEAYTDCYFKQLKRLQAENERLKEELRNNSDVLIHEMGLKDEYQSDYVFEKLERQKYKQALQEIRDMADNQKITAEYTINKIIDRINEVIGAE